MPITCQYICIFTSDLAKGRHFYEELLGLKLLKQIRDGNPDDHADFYQLTPDLQLAIWQKQVNATIDKQGTTSMICLNFSNQSLIIHKLQALDSSNAQLIEPLHLTSYGHMRCIVADPNNQYWEWCAPTKHI